MHYEARQHRGGAQHIVRVDDDGTEHVLLRLAVSRGIALDIAGALAIEAERGE